MELARILRKGWTATVGPDETGIVSADTLCGSTASHFEVSDGRLSFFKLESISAKTAAIAVALGRKEVDEVEYLTITDDILKTVGIELEDNPGKTSYSVVNNEHVDGCGINLSKLSSLIIHSAQKGTPGVLESREVVREICEAYLEDPESIKINEKLLERLLQTKAYKKIASERKKLGCPPIFPE
ncbi:hypothetical protein [Xanthomonas campestris]|uniref:hypothetical protein n=1 Tax=Xanthomonas campestris TaxID=339 RepID=UPI002B22B21F|nr:hypothetical protein [Xanthomonas campestris]MEA9708547.1 hypothetical protein [Xanthomonas campestris pv. raphani]